MTRQHRYSGCIADRAHPAERSIEELAPRVEIPRFLPNENSGATCNLRKLTPELCDASAYCLPMNVPFTLMLSSTTMLAPASGPSSRTMWILFTLVPGVMAGTVCAALVGSKRRRFHPVAGDG